VSWRDLHAQVLGEFCEAQASMADALCSNWFDAHSRYLLRRKLAKKAWTLRAMRKRLFNTAVIECANAKCRVAFVPYRKNIVYCSNACRVRELGLKAYYRRRVPLPTRTCPVCQKSFSQKRRHAMYCSVRCRSVAGYHRRKAAWALNPLVSSSAVRPSRPCKRCGASVVGRRSDARYCSMRCSRASKWVKLYKENRSSVLAQRAAYRVANRERVNAWQRAAHRRRKGAA